MGNTRENLRMAPIITFIYKVSMTWKLVGKGVLFLDAIFT